MSGKYGQFDRMDDEFKDDYFKLHSDFRDDYLANSVEEQRKKAWWSRFHAIFDLCFGVLWGLLFIIRVIIDINEGTIEWPVAFILMMLSFELSTLYWDRYKAEMVELKKRAVTLLTYRQNKPLGS